MATHDVQRPGRDANAIAFEAAGAADGWANTGRELLIVRHTDGGGESVTATVPLTVTVDGLSTSDREIAIGPGETHILGPFPGEFYNDAEGLVWVSWEDSTDIEIAVIRP